MRIAMASDHNGVAYKTRLIAMLAAHGHTVDDRGAAAADGVVDYPPLCAEVCWQVVNGAADRGIVVGGSGQGEAIACNKVRGVRAGLCQDLFGVGISRGNNDSNVLVLGAKVVTLEQAEQLVMSWLETRFKGGEHQRRIDQISALERGEPFS